MNYSEHRGGVLQLYKPKFVRLASSHSGPRPFSLQRWKVSHLPSVQVGVLTSFRIDN